MRQPKLRMMRVTEAAGVVVDAVRYATKEQRAAVLERDRYQCRYCGIGVTWQLANIDHVIPWKHGGPTKVDNLVACCPDCNKRKGNQWGRTPKPTTRTKAKRTYKGPAHELTPYEREFLERKRDEADAKKNTGKRTKQVLNSG